MYARATPRIVFVALVAAGLAVFAAAAQVAAAPTSARPAQIAFYRGDEGERGSVYLVNADGNGLRRVGAGSGSSCGIGAEEERSLDWSADGRLLAYSDNPSADTSSIRVLVPGGKPVTVAPSGADDNLTYLRPRIAPNGRLVAFCLETNPDSRDDSLVLEVADARHPAGSRSLTDGTVENAFEPIWSPRSDEIAYSNGSQLVIVTPNGRRVAVIRDVSAANPDWSPTGARIAYASSAGIDTVRPDGGGRRLVARIRGATAPAWSPRGRTIAFAASPTGDEDRNAIYEANSDGKGGLRRMTPPLLNAIQPVWSPDGTRLAFVVPGRGIWVASATRPGDAKQITRGKDYSPAWRSRS